MRIRIVKNHRTDKYCVETCSYRVHYNKNYLTVEDIVYFETPIDLWYPVIDNGLVVFVDYFATAQYIVEQIKNYHKGTEVIVEYEV